MLDTSYTSRALAGTLHFEVYLPPGYDTSGLRYPVVYFLHGLPSQPVAYRSVRFVERALDTVGRQAILVIPQAARAGESDPEYVNQGPGHNWGTAIARELPKVVDARFRTIASRGGRAIVGVSAGGYGAMHLALAHLDAFSVVESWSGYFHPTDPTGTQPLDLGSADRDTKADVHQQLAAVREKLQALPEFIAFYVGRVRPAFRRRERAPEPGALGGRRRARVPPLRRRTRRRASGSAMRRRGSRSRSHISHPRASRGVYDLGVASTTRPATLDPLDFLAIDALLDEEERAIRDTVRQFVRERIVPEVGEWFEQGILPREIVQEIAQLGLFGMHLDGYGLPGASAVAYGLTCLELEAGDSGVRSLVSVQGSLAMFAIWKWGSEEQKQRWLPAMHAGEAIGCFGLTEPDAGSDPGSMRTTARRDGSDWILNGAKMWITNGTVADISVVWARTEDGAINGFLVERDTPGFEAPEMHRKLSLRASVTSELVLRDVRVPEENRFPEISTLRGPLSCLNEARYGIVWGAVGAGRACLESALDYAKERVVFGKPIAGYQLTQQKLAEMALEVNRGTLVALHIGRMKDAGTLLPEHVSMGKMGNVRGALEVARTARSILGGNGITLEYPVIRHMNNLESVLTYEGTHEVHTLSVGKALTGENAFRG